MNRASRWKAQGYTLLEIMLVMVIAAIIMITAVVAYQRYNDRQQAQRMAELSGVMVNNIRQQFQTYDNCGATATGYCGTYSGAGNLNTYFLQSGIVPNELLNNPANPTATKTPWGGTIAFAASTLNGNANSGLDITYSNVPSNVCTNMVPILSANAAKISVNGTVVKDATTAAAQGGGSANLNIGTLTSKCTSNSTVVMTLDSPSAYSAGTGITNNGLPTSDSGYTGAMQTYRIQCPILDASGNPTGSQRDCFDATYLAALSAQDFSATKTAACANSVCGTMTPPAYTNSLQPVTSNSPPSYPTTPNPTAQSGYYMHNGSPASPPVVR